MLDNRFQVKIDFVRGIPKGKYHDITYLIKSRLDFPTIIKYMGAIANTFKIHLNPMIFTDQTKNTTSYVVKVC